MHFNPLEHKLTYIHTNASTNIPVVNRNNNSNQILSRLALYKQQQAQKKTRVPRSSACVSTKYENTRPVAQTNCSCLRFCAATTAQHCVLPLQQRLPLVRHHHSHHLRIAAAVDRRHRRRCCCCCCCCYRTRSVLDSIRIVVHIYTGRLNKSEQIR